MNITYHYCTVFVIVIEGVILFKNKINLIQRYFNLLGFILSL